MDGKGSITPAGIMNSKGELMPRAKQEPRMGLSVEDELTIDMWNKALKRDFPNLDNAFIDLISTYCYMHPEEAQNYAREHALQDPSTRKYKTFEHLDAVYERAV